ncbi:MAG: hypothetical protein A4E35_01340 [Methanoregula sp. PtaU1.Bin051]|nr:MAG: hypothetical protein A4E35_01340 [Methanoregula sp. PtaU1.Bin051]
MPSGRLLLFIYNADSESLPKPNEMIRTAIPDKDECNLLALTYSPIGMKKEWKRFIHDIGIPVRFLARDEFGTGFKNISTTFPIVFMQEGSSLFHFISTDEINRCRELDQLIGLIRERVTQFGDKTA